MTPASVPKIGVPDAATWHIPLTISNGRKRAAQLEMSGALDGEGRSPRRRRSARFPRAVRPLPSQRTVVSPQSPSLWILIFRYAAAEKKINRKRWPPRCAQV
jgi:hypothetical protein